MASEEHPQLQLAQIAVHVMARETKLTDVITSCESTWAASFPLVYYHADRGVAMESGYAVSNGRWAVGRNLAKRADAPTDTNGAANDDGSDGGGSSSSSRRSSSRSSSSSSSSSGLAGRVARIAALTLPERPKTGGGEHWKISHDKGMGWNTWLRFKMRYAFAFPFHPNHNVCALLDVRARVLSVDPCLCASRARAIFEWSVRAPWAEMREVQWYVYVDDDTCACYFLLHTSSAPRLSLSPTSHADLPLLHLCLRTDPLPLPRIGDAVTSSSHRCSPSCASTIQASRITLVDRYRKRATLPSSAAALV